MKPIIFLIAGLFLLLFSASISTHVQSSLGPYCSPGNCYVAGYFTNARALAGNAFFGTDFQGTDYTSFPGSAYSLQSMLSVVGRVTTGSCPCVYQSVYVIYTNGEVDYEPQVWGDTGFSITSGTVINVGANTTYEFDGLMTANSSGIVYFKGFVYDTLKSFTNNFPYVYNAFSYNSGDTKFYYGKDTLSGYLVKYLQFGVESNANLTGPWNVDQREIEIQEATVWHYYASETVEGEQSYASDCSGCVIGGQTFGTASFSGATNDALSWIDSSSPVGSGVSIWTGTGGYEPQACMSSSGC